MILTLVCAAGALWSGCATSSSRGAAPPTLCVVRHAPSYHNLSPPPEDMSAETRDALTPEGQRMAEALGAELTRAHQITRVRSSPLGRARQTAAALEEAAQVTTQVEPALRPMGGDMTWEARDAAWARGEDPRPAGGESLSDVQARVRGMLQSLRVDARAGTTTVLVTHGDTASVVLGELAQTPLLQRPRAHTLGPGQARCAPWPRA